MKRRKRSKAVSDHWAMLREIGCIVTGQANPTIHHCHGGSLRELGVTKGMGCKTSDWLVIPLALELHSYGPQAIDGAMGVQSWEAVYGTQVEHLDRICELTGVDVWERAGVQR